LYPKFLAPEEKQGIQDIHEFISLVSSYVDQTPQDIMALDHIVKLWEIAKKGALPGQGKESGRVVRNMIELVRRYNMPHSWVDAFLQSAHMDTLRSSYKNVDELREYLYGSVEAIGLMQARVLHLPAEMDEAMQAQAAAVRLINFVAEIATDEQLGRQYLPVDEMRSVGLESLDHKAALAQPRAFAEFVHRQLMRYSEWQKEANRGLQGIPLRYRRAILTTNDGYASMARKIAKNPLAIFNDPPRLQLNYLARRAILRQMLG
jgi:15-cis-phytoene synthase